MQQPRPSMRRRVLRWVLALALLNLLLSVLLAPLVLPPDAEPQLELLEEDGLGISNLDLPLERPALASRLEPLDRVERDDDAGLLAWLEANRGVVDEHLEAGGTFAPAPWPHGPAVPTAGRADRHLKLALALGVRLSRAEGLDEAWADLRRLVLLIGLLEEPSNGSIWRRDEVSELLLRLAQESLARGRPPAQTASSLRDLIAAREPPGSASWALRCELARGLRVFEGMRGALGSEQQAFEDLARQELRPILESITRDPGPLDRLRQDLNRDAYVTYMAAIIRVAAQETPEAVSELEGLRETALPDATITPEARWIAVLRAASHPGDSLRLSLLVRTRLRLVSVALAVSALAELPDSLELPSDPWAPGEPLQWRRDGPRMGVLWSVGPEDEGREGRLRLRVKLPPVG